MIFLPNIFERYTASLRNSIHLSAIRSGLKKRHIKNMKKIYIAEALFSKETEIPVNISNLTSRLLTVFFIKRLELGFPFEFKVNLSRNSLLKPKLYTAFLLSICSCSNSVEIYNSNGKIIIKAFNYCGNVFTPLTKKINAVPFFERKRKIALFILSFDTTDKKAKQINIEYSADPFTPTNLFAFK